MPATYQVVLLSNKEFDKVAKSNPRYKNVDEDNMGFSDPESGKAYVRNTHWAELNKYLISHEFEHLLESEGTHEDELGIRHKKFFKQLVAPLLGPVVGALPIPGAPIAGAALSATLPRLTGQRQAAPGGGGVLGGIAQAAGAALPAFGGGLGKVGAAPSGIPPTGGQAPGFNIPTALGGAGLGPGRLLGSQGVQGNIFSRLGVQGAPGVGTSGIQNPIQASTQGLAGLLGSQGNVFNHLFQQGNFPGIMGSQAGSQTVGAAPVPTPVAKPASGISGFFGSDLGKTLLGGGISLLGSQFGKGPSAPDFRSLGSIQGLQGMAGQPTSEVAKLATQRLTGRLSTGLSPDIITDTNRIFDRERNRAISQYKTLINPNADEATDPNYRAVLLDVEQRRSAALAEARQQDLQREAGDIQTALGIDQTTFDQLSQLANLDIDTLQTQFALKREKAQNIRDIFGKFGALLAPQPSQPSLTLNLGSFGTR